jgi:hypothetical protein
LKSCGWIFHTLQALDGALQHDELLPEQHVFGD